MRESQPNYIDCIAIPADPTSQMDLCMVPDGDLGTFQRLVGDDIQVVQLYEPPASLYVAESGKLNGAEVNHRATIITWLHNSAFRGADVIVGNAVLLGEPDELGNDQSAPDHYVDLLKGNRQCRIERRQDDDWKDTGLVYPNWPLAYADAIQFYEPDTARVRTMKGGDI